jgi:hypothetical protein
MLAIRGLTKLELFGSIADRSSSEIVTNFSV